MQNSLRCYLSGLLVFMMLAGCGIFTQETPSPPANQFSLEQVQLLIQKTRKTLEVLEKLPVQERYAEHWQKAQEELSRSEKLLQKQSIDEAYQAADQSLEASRYIVRHFYQQVLAQSAQKAKADIRIIAEDDPDNPLQDFLPKLNEILDYADDIDDEQMLIDLQRILADAEELAQIEHNTKENVKRTLEMDISFASGQYELMEQGKLGLQEHYREILAGKTLFESLYPNQTIIITIKVVGYTDLVRFTNEKSQIKHLLKGIEHEMPQRQPAQRKFLNQRLSELRARTIAEYLTELITQGQTAQEQLQIHQEVVGLGETLPPDIPPPYPIEDPRRRICKIYSYITTDNVQEVHDKD